MRKILTNQINKNSHCGISVRNTQEYFLIKNKYNSMMSNMNENYVKSNYALISNLKYEIIDILQNKSKDLELFVWLTYLSILLDGFDGFIEMLEVLIDIIESYFLTIHPIITDYADTQDEIIEIKINFIHQLDLKVNKLINTYIYLDELKTYPLINLIKIKELENIHLKQIVHNNISKCKKVLEQIQKIKELLQNLFSVLKQYDNYHNNSDIITPNFQEILKNLGIISERISTHLNIEIHNIQSINDSNLKNNQNNNLIKINIEHNTSGKEIVAYMLELCEMLEKYHSYKIIAHSLQFCLNKIPANSVELARLIREDNIMANFIDAVINFIDNNFKK